MMTIISPPWPPFVPPAMTRSRTRPIWRSRADFSISPHLHLLPAAVAGRRRPTCAVRVRYRLNRRGTPEDLIVAAVTVSTSRKSNARTSGATTDGATWIQLAIMIGSQRNNGSNFLSLAVDKSCRQAFCNRKFQGLRRGEAIVINPRTASREQFA